MHIYKEVILGIILTIAIIIIGLVNGNVSETSTIDSSDFAFTKITFEGHDYLILAFGHNGHFIHSESCPCKKGNIK